MLMSSAAQRFDDDVSSDGDYFTTSSSSAGESDFCSRDGAHALKAKIEAYWRDRGHTVMVALHNVGFHPAIRAARYDVRSDMVNGLPRGAAQRKRAPAPAANDAYVEDFDNSDDDLVFE
jgi:hypothetical protein